MNRSTLIFTVLGMTLVGFIGLLWTQTTDTPELTEHDWEPAKVRLGKRNATESPAPGLWGKAETRKLTEEIEQLEAIGYIGGTDEPETDQAGITIHKPQAVQGLNFYVSGHDAVATLMTMDGTVLHQWQRRFHTVWPDKKPDKTRPAHQFWRRAHLFPNGDLLVIFEGYGLVKLDRESNVLWSWDGGAHHDLEVLPDGRIWVLSRDGRRIPSLYKKPVMVDHASLLSPDGEELRRINLLEAVLRSGAGAITKKSRRRGGDIFHTNTISLLTESEPKHPEFTAGRLLLSMRTLSALMVLDPDTESMVWWHRGKYREQHDPKILPNGNMLLFDNLGRTNKDSIIREYDPVTMKQVWRYDGTEDSPFFSRFCGTAERFDNGNTLITESSRGRVFEVTQEGEIVWEFRNEHRAGENNEYIAIIPELLRIPEDTVDFPFSGPLNTTDE